MSIVRNLTRVFHADFYSGILKNMHDYYHPMFRAGSVTPLWHMMIAVSTIMYTTSYASHKYGVVQHEREIQKKALEEYYEKHGGAPDHH